MSLQATLPEVERLRTNTYLVGFGPRRILIDTGEGKPAWSASVSRVLADEQASISLAILTHWHHDHIEGVPDLLSFSPETKIYKHDPSEGQLDILHDQKFEADGVTLSAFHCPGHTTDHIALVLEEEDAMFTGDNVLGQGTAVFEDLAAYMYSLSRMATRFSGRAYPGHGPVIENGNSRIAEYIKHREERESQILNVLGRDKEDRSRSDHGWTPVQIVKIIYDDVPESLHVAAQRGVLQVLDKLVEDGKVSYNEVAGSWSLKDRSAL
ncbi:Metallo-hydrolase/oxidoreductase [Saccharata proteae CBS 121410]|uniref:Metallo-hydrolase/oxidoreductase n=1 Tax=Saccharata proteae CBS 121410 TaxID=1314787 RepID=A0A9P4HRX3_9PEZI|nr:Metallo-hydrolase/oxidoreductase [Saccharata proteae CBS 121410]